MRKSKTSTQLGTITAKLNSSKSILNHSKNSSTNISTYHSKHRLKSSKLCSSISNTNYSIIEIPSTPIAPPPPLSTRNLPSQKFLFQKTLSSKTTQQFSMDPSLDNMNIHSISMNSHPHRKSILIKNKINFKERSEIKKTAETFISYTKSYGTLFDIDPSKLMYGNSNKKSSSLMKKTLYDILPKQLKYNYATSSQFRNLLLNTKGALHQQKKDIRKCFYSTTVLIKKYKQQNKVLEQLLKQRSKASSHNKQMILFLRLQSIKWLWQHKSLLIEKLFLYYQNYKWFFDKNEYLDRKKFKEFLIITNLGKDDEFAEHLFLTFEKQDHDLHTEVINFKECLFNFILTAEYSYERKVQLMLSIIELTSGKKVPVDKLMKLLGMTLLNGKEWNYIGGLFRDHGIDIKGNCNVEKNVVFRMLMGSDVVKGILDRYYARYMEVNLKLSEQLVDKFNFVVPNMMNIVYQNNGVKVCNNLEIEKLDKILDIKKEKMELCDKVQDKLRKHKKSHNEEDESDNEESENDK